MAIPGLDFNIGDTVQYGRELACEVLAIKDGGAKVSIRPNGKRARWVARGSLTVNGEVIKDVETTVLDERKPPLLAVDGNEVTLIPEQPPSVIQPSELDVEDVLNQVRKIQHLMTEVMIEGSHFGTIPGCGDKPTLLKPGAEKLSLTFRLVPKFEVTQTELDGGHREYHVVCELIHQPTSSFAGEGVGMCTSMESKYRYRSAERVCPKCGKAAVIKGKADYGGGWLCWKKKEGCNAKWGDASEQAKAFEKVTAKAENPDPADTFNTVLKMGKKRAHVDAIITALSVSDMFTQDIEDLQQRSEPAPTPPDSVGAEPPATGYGLPRGHNPAPQQGWDKDEYGEPDYEGDGPHDREPFGAPNNPPPPPERTARVEGYLAQAAFCATMPELVALAVEVANAGLTAQEKAQIQGPWREIKNQLGAGGP